LRWGLWAVCEAWDHTGDALQQTLTFCVPSDVWNVHWTTDRTESVVSRIGIQSDSCGKG
jgi:hypothetical protein